MPPTQALISFVVTIQLLELLPGADMAMTMRNTIRGGRRAGIRTMLGVNTSKAHVGLFLAGLSALIATSAAVYTVVKVVGAAYLAYLGIRMILESRRAVPLEIEAVGHATVRRPYVQGLLTNLLNPKAVLFTVAFLPQFVDADASLAPQALVLTAILVLNGLVWGTAIDTARAALARPSLRRRLDRLFGVVFVALGARVALESR